MNFGLSLDYSMCSVGQKRKLDMFIGTTSSPTALLKKGETQPKELARFWSLVAAQPCLTDKDHFLSTAYQMLADMLNRKMDQLITDKKLSVYTYVKSCFQSGEREGEDIEKVKKMFASAVSGTLSISHEEHKKIVRTEKIPAYIRTQLFEKDVVLVSNEGKKYPMNLFQLAALFKKEYLASLRNGNQTLTTGIPSERLDALFMFNEQLPMELEDYVKVFNLADHLREEQITILKNGLIELSGKIKRNREFKVYSVTHFFEQIERMNAFLHNKFLLSHIMAMFSNLYPEYLRFDDRMVALKKGTESETSLLLEKLHFLLNRYAMELNILKNPFFDKNFPHVKFLQVLNSEGKNINETDLEHLFRVFPNLETLEFYGKDLNLAVATLISGKIKNLLVIGKVNLPSDSIKVENFCHLGDASILNDAVSADVKVCLNESGVLDTSKHPNIDAGFLVVILASHYLRVLVLNQCKTLTLNMLANMLRPSPLETLAINHCTNFILNSVTHVTDCRQLLVLKYFPHLNNLSMEGLNYSDELIRDLFAKLTALNLNHCTYVGATQPHSAMNSVMFNPLEEIVLPRNCPGLLYNAVLKAPHLKKVTFYNDYVADRPFLLTSFAAKRGIVSVTLLGVPGVLPPSTTPEVPPPRLPGGVSLYPAAPGSGILINSQALLTKVEKIAFVAVAQPFAYLPKGLVIDELALDNCEGAGDTELIKGLYGVSGLTTLKLNQAGITNRAVDAIASVFTSIRNLHVTNTPTITAGPIKRLLAYSQQVTWVDLRGSVNVNVDKLKELKAKHPRVTIVHD